MWMIKKRIKVVKTLSKPWTVKDMQIFFGFANFYKRFIKIFGKIAVSLSSMLKLISEPSNNYFSSTKTNKQIYNKEVKTANSAVSNGSVYGHNKNPSKTGKLKDLAKSKTSNLVKRKKSN